jgi:hypothetical protein
MKKLSVLIVVFHTLLITAMAFAEAGQKTIPAQARTAAETQPTPQPAAAQDISSSPAIQSRLKGLSADAQAKLLEQVRSLLAQKQKVAAPVPTRKADKYTQSEAHLSLSKIRVLVQKTYPDALNYLNFIISVLAKEGKYKDTHYAFYHGVTNDWRVPQDLYRKLYLAFRTGQTKDELEDFQFIRFQPTTMVQTPKEFIVEQLTHNGLINDTLKTNIKSVIMSVNIALFGNVGVAQECTWEYFMKSQSHSLPNKSHIENILKAFGADTKYADKIVRLGRHLHHKTQTLLQIMVPHEIVDKIAYASFLKGTPADTKTLNFVLKEVAAKKKRKKFTTPTRELSALEQVFKKEQEDNDLFNNMLQAAKADSFAITTLMDGYRNQPDKMGNLNDLQARILLTRNIITDPNVGIKFFRYSAHSAKKISQYEAEFDAIIKQIIAEKVSQKRKKT